MVQSIVEDPSVEENLRRFEDAAPRRDEVRRARSPSGHAVAAFRFRLVEFLVGLVEKRLYVPDARGSEATPKLAVALMVFASTLISFLSIASRR